MRWGWNGVTGCGLCVKDFGDVDSRWQLDRGSSFCRSWEGLVTYGDDDLCRQCVFVYVLVIVCEGRLG